MLKHLWLPLATATLCACHSGDQRAEQSLAVERSCMDAAAEALHGYMQPAFDNWVARCMHQHGEHLYPDGTPVP